MSASAFQGISSYYARFRPSYPDEALEALWTYALRDRPALRSAPRALDVGAGTGISTLALHASAPIDIEVVAVEPGEDMRAEAERSLAGIARVRVLHGFAESLPCPDGSVGLVLAAQSVQWFQRPAFYAEAGRVLHVGGTLAVMQNNRDWRSSGLLAAYEAFLERNNRSYRRDYRSFDVGLELSSIAGLCEQDTVVVGWTRTMELADFLGMALSSTKMHQVVVQRGMSSAVQMLREALAPHIVDENAVDVPYTTELFLARRCVYRP
jgi:ubiquinone/menaquinone biosynthesis C-methylase UbiE